MQTDRHGLEDRDRTQGAQKTSPSPLSIVESPLSFFRMHWDHEPAKHRMAMPARKRAPRNKTAESYLHPEADSPMRPEVGTQAQFKKKRPPQMIGLERCITQRWRSTGSYSVRKVRRRLRPSTSWASPFKRIRLIPQHNNVAPEMIRPQRKALSR